MVLALREERLPATLHVDVPSSKVDWSAGDVELLTSPREWSRGEAPRRAGVSSFGASGTNAHVIVEEAPQDAVEPGAAEGPALGGPVVWVVSGKLPSGLAAQARGLREWLGVRPGWDPVDVGWSLAATRAQLSHRAVVIGADRDALLTALDKVAAGEAAPGVILSSGARTGGTAFVVPAAGKQSLELARELLVSAPVFADRLRECADALAPHTGWDLYDVVRGVPGAPSADEAEVFGPVLFAVQVALATLWHSHGVEPDAVVAEPGAETAAAVISGRRTLQEAARAVARRGAAGSQAAEPLPDSVRVKVEQGFRAFVAISPEPVLADTLTAAVTAAGGDASEFMITRLPAEADGTADATARPSAFLLMLAQANVGGVRVDWSPLYADSGARTVRLPTYRFQRQRYWLAEAKKAAGTAAPLAAPQPSAGPERRSGTFTVLVRRAHLENAIAEAVPMLVAASRFRPSFTSVAELGDAPRSILAADGDTSPAAICVPSFLAGSG
ncbi:MAG TPA: acyltransferase domain-containing protein, partial [Streptomyces sp.]